jgi:hypothetical protein
MGIIVMWKRGVRECVLAVDDERILVRMIDGNSLLREVAIASAESAVRTAEIWEIEERRAAWHDAAVPSFDSGLERLASA